MSSKHKNAKRFLPNLTMKVRAFFYDIRRRCHVTEYDDGRIECHNF